MTRSDRQIVDKEILRQEALSWLRRLNTGEATAGDLSEFEEWRATSPAHAREFSEVSLLWTVLGEAAKKATAASVDIRTLETARSERHLSRRALFVGSALVASVAGAMVVRPPMGLWPSFTELAADYRTGTGGHQQIDVTDRVTVQMNTRTSLDLRSEMRIELLAGEAAFTKRDGPDNELVVLAGSGQATANDASFNVRRDIVSRDMGLVRVTCLDGEVRVRCGTGEAAIRKGQQIAYDAHRLSDIATIDTEIVTAWKRGLLIFRRTPLSEVLDEVNRYRSGQIILMDAKLAQRQVVANFRLDRIEDVIEFISKAMNVPTRSLPGGIVLVG